MSHLSIAEKRKLRKQKSFNRSSIGDQTRQADNSQAELMNDISDNRIVPVKNLNAFGDDEDDIESTYNRLKQASIDGGNERRKKMVLPTDEDQGKKNRLKKAFSVYETRYKDGVVDSADALIALQAPNAEQRRE